MLLSSGNTAIKWIKTKTLLQKLRSFQPNLSIFFETEDFIVKTARTPNELLEVLELRHEIFVREWQGRQLPFGVDVDKYDFEADHLIIWSKSQNRAVGTYRLLCSRFTNRFYSQSEFQLHEFLRWGFTKLEMGRACVHPDFRDGNTIDLLWKGLSRYIDLAGVRFLFGCSSVRIEDQRTSEALMKSFFEKGQWSDDFHIRPTKKYSYNDFSMESAFALSPTESRKLVPPLLRSYMSAGAKVYGHPAYDRSFSCIDVLTILDMKQLNPRFRQRFF
ncbi:MAG: GNAT family N-acetyltransferase [Bdellovibrionaceae bacterium]|nr:GNAT family N-acetyltransferase [Pseudobdellovibrionaceae bacterium]|tara:strand:+ start:771 stop:1592 length:822 start_codon:yes stop_codon:yes gene_type:complete